MELIGQIGLVELTSVKPDDFTGLVERQSRFVFRVAYAILRNPADAEDVAQDLFLKLHRSGAWREVEDERAFLARAAWRLAVDRRARRTVVEMPDLATESHEQALIESDRRALVHRLMDGLPEELRQVLALSGIEELNSRQIAEVVGVPEGTVRTRLARARQVLKERLAAVLEGRRG